MIGRGLPTRPRLADDVALDWSDGMPVLRARKPLPERLYSLGAAGAEFARRVLPLLDGHHTLAEIEGSLTAEFDLDSLQDALDHLAEHLLIVDAADPTEPVDGVHAYRILRLAERRWARLLRRERAEIPELADPAASLSPEAYERWFRGWWAENLHFAAAAPMKFALVANRCPPHAATLASFFLEEHDHILIFRNGARALGVDPDAAMRSPPLPESAALSSFILRGAKRQPLYLAWIADQVERAQVLYMRNPEDGTNGGLRQELQAKLAAVPDFLDLVFSHADIEQAAAHATGGRGMFEATEAVTPADLAEILELSLATEHLFHRKEAAVLRLYGLGTATAPRPGANELARLAKGAPPVDIAADVARVIEPMAASLVGPVGPRFLAGWAHLHREWASSSFDTPILARRFEQRYAATRLARSLVLRRDALQAAGPVASADLDARSLAAVVCEAAETSPLLALAQAALLDRVGAVLEPALPADLPEAARAPLGADLPHRTNGPAEALGAFGRVDAEEAQCVGAHLQVVGELVRRVVGQPPSS